MTKTFTLPDGTTFTTQFDDALFWLLDTCQCQVIVRPSPAPVRDFLHVHTFLFCDIHKPKRGQALIDDIFGHTRPLNANPDPTNPDQEAVDAQISAGKSAESQRIRALGPPTAPVPPD